MRKHFLKFTNVSFGYENSLTDIFRNVSFQFSTGWTGLIGANGSGKTTLLKLACGLLDCASGTIETPDNFYYNEQRTDDAPEQFYNFINSFDKLAIKLIDELKIEQDWVTRWDTLSHGERKRVQIACALWNQPDLLAIDEPTNHLDMIAKNMIVDSLKSFKGIGLIISHDRDLIENLCEQFLFIDFGKVEYRRGRLSETTAQRQLENESALKQFEIKQIEISKLENEYKRRSEIVEQSKKKISKKKIDRKDRDAKGKIDLARLTGKDAGAGRLKTIMKARLENAKTELQNIDIKRGYKTGILLSSSSSPRNYLLNLEPGSLQLSPAKKLVYSNLFVLPRDKIALTGENGSGKSSFIKYILTKLNADSENITYIPQEITIDQTKELMNEIYNLPNEQLGKLLIIVSRLGSDAKRILETDLPSPGETRKLLLGLGITKNPHIIIMDEPTNHMDIVSIECLEDALKNVRCAMLLVSHDKRFLSELTSVEWEIDSFSNENELLVKYH